MNLNTNNKLLLAVFSGLCWYVIYPVVMYGFVIRWLLSEADSFKVILGVTLAIVVPISILFKILGKFENEA